MVFLIIFGLRIVAIYVLDSPERISVRPWFRTILLAMSLCITDSGWLKDDEYPIESRNAFKCLAVLTTLENSMSIIYAAFLTVSTGLSSKPSLCLVIATFILMWLRWLLLYRWLLPVVYPELMHDESEEEIVLSEKSDIELINALSSNKSGDNKPVIHSTSPPKSSKRMSMFISNTKEENNVPLSVGWKPSKSKKFYDLRRKQAKEKKQNQTQTQTQNVVPINTDTSKSKIKKNPSRRGSVIAGVGKIALQSVVEQDSDDEDLVAKVVVTEIENSTIESSVDLGTDEVNSSKTFENPIAIANKSIEIPEVESTVNKLLYVGILDKSGPSNMIWYPWQTRLVVMTTEVLEYYSIPYLAVDENADHGSKGFKTNSVVVNKSNRMDTNKSLAYLDLDSMRTVAQVNSVRNDGGLQALLGFLSERDYKKKVSFSVSV